MSNYATFPARARIRIPAADIVRASAIDARFAAVVAREQELDEREMALQQIAYQSGLQQAMDVVRAENSVHAAWLVANTVDLSREILNTILQSVQSALRTVLADEQSQIVVESRVRKLVTEIADRNIKLYCANVDFDRVEQAVDSLRDEHDVSIGLNIDEALETGDMVVESDDGVIHASVAGFVETTTEIIRTRVEQSLFEAGEAHTEFEVDEANKHDPASFDVQDDDLEAVANAYDADEPEALATLMNARTERNNA
jgi:flagellar biosynthesis/type III secretory pathway protein FliH